MPATRSVSKWSEILIYISLQNFSHSSSYFNKVEIFHRILYFFSKQFQDSRCFFTHFMMMTTVDSNRTLRNSIENWKSLQKCYNNFIEKFPSVLWMTNPFLNFPFRSYSNRHIDDHEWRWFKFKNYLNWWWWQKSGEEVKWMKWLRPSLTEELEKRRNDTNSSRLNVVLSLNISNGTRSKLKCERRENICISEIELHNLTPIESNLNVRNSNSEKKTRL